MHPLVKCSVANCQFWGQGNNCHADAIMIEIDKHADRTYDTEFSGDNFDTEHQDKASESRNTCCLTFVPKAKA